MLGEPRGDEGAATAMDERAKDAWSPFAPAQRVVLPIFNFAKLRGSRRPFSAIPSSSSRSCLM